MVLSLSSALSLCLGLLPSQSVFDNVSQMAPAGAVTAGIDGANDQLLQALGTSIVRLDLAAIRGCELGSPTTPCDADGVLAGASADIDASILKLTALTSNAYLACAGDEGLYGVVNDSMDLIDVDAEGRWCFDAAVSDDFFFLYALFAGYDDSQLRVYLLPPFVPDITLVSTVPLSSSTPMPPSDPAIRPGTSYALDVRGYDAYVAHGRGGLLRVHPYADAFGGLAWDVDQGPPSDPGATGCAFPGDCFAFSRMRDIEIVGDHLYAAADALGLVEVDLTLPWDANTPMVSVAPVNPDPIPSCTVTDPVQFGRRVDALEDPGQPGTVVISLGTIARPTIFTEGGPYEPYGGFGWELSLSNLPQEPGQPVGCENHLFIFERDGGAPTQSLHMRVTAPKGAVPEPVGPVSWDSLDMHYADGRFWVYDESANAWRFERDGSGDLVNLTSNGADFVYSDYTSRSPSTTLGVASPSDPTLLLFGQDGGEGNKLAPGLARVQDPDVVEVPGTSVVDDPDRHRLGLYVDAWPDADLVHDWSASSFQFNGTDQIWKVARFDPSDVGHVWDWWMLQFPEDPLVVGNFRGRAYAPVASDEGSDILALARSFTRSAVALYERSAVMSEATAGGTGVGTLLTTPPILQLDVHPDLGSGVVSPGGFHCLGMKFFDLGARRVLGVASGYSQAAATEELPKWTFIDLGDTSTFGPGWAPAATREVYGPTGPGMGSGLDVVELGGTTYGIALETSGRAHLFDLTDLFTTGAVLVDTYELPENIYDGLREIPLGIDIDPDGAGPGVPVAYVGINRAGVLKLAFDQTSVPATFDAQSSEIVNTPGQAVGVHFYVDGGGIKRLAVGDHGPLGLRVYRDTP